jgi:hypothetical protein
MPATNSLKSDRTIAAKFSQHVSLIAFTTSWNTTRHDKVLADRCMVLVAHREISFLYNDRIRLLSVRHSTMDA